MTARRLHNVDLNLLPALEALLEEGSVSKAARRIGLSQPALSHALARLRLHYDDPILLRAGSTMALTPLAERLRDELRTVLDRVEGVVHPRTSFDPTTSDAHFRIRALITIPWLPKLNALLRGLAPKMTVQIVTPASSVSDDLVRQLASGELSVAFVSARLIPEGVVHAPLADDSFSVLSRRGTRLTLARYLRADHVLVSPFGGRVGIVDEVLSARGMSRRCVVIVPSFAQVGDLVAGSDLLATVPSSIARSLASVHGLRVLSAPLELPTNRAALVWHPRTAHDPASRWFRAQLVASLPAEMRPSQLP
ncbi:MAG: LysR family transcriptional regulator [Myxococcales bacterium]|nr:LysR family transcriptional regulator [Myxococcales bacterium]